MQPGPQEGQGDSSLSSQANLAFNMPAAAAAIRSEVERESASQVKIPRP